MNVEEWILLEPEEVLTNMEWSPEKLAWMENRLWSTPSQTLVEVCVLSSMKATPLSWSEKMYSILTSNHVSMPMYLSTSTVLFSSMSYMLLMSNHLLMTR